MKKMFLRRFLFGAYPPLLSDPIIHPYRDESPSCLY